MGPTPREPTVGDAFGAALLAFSETGDRTDHHVVERDDGWIDPIPTAVYFRPDGEWSGIDGAALDRARGAVLDIGAGAGRHSVELQRRGLDVTALDVSPGALEVCRRRGVATVFAGSIIDMAASTTGAFETFMLMGNNLALLENRTCAAEFLGALEALARPGAQVLGVGMDPHMTSDPDHLAYHRWNRERGRMVGQIGIRIRYRNLATAWRDILFAGIEELVSLLDGSPWKLAEHTEPGPVYLATLELR